MLWATFVLSLLPFALVGETHRVSATAYHHTFSAVHPVLARIKPGDVVITKALDAGGNDEKGEKRAEPSNPLTGPFYVEGAEPGDALVVQFRRVALNRNWGWTNYRLLLTALTPEYVERFFVDGLRYLDGRVGPGGDDDWRLDFVPAEIDISPSNDPRSYRLNSDRLLATGFAPRHGVRDAIQEVIEAFRAGTLRVEDDCYNVKAMKLLAL